MVTADDLDVAQEAMTSEEAWRRWPGEKQSTFTRMRDAARAEASRIENAQMARMIAGFITAPMPSEVAKRDDMIALYRLVDRIIADESIMNRLRTYK